MSYYVDENYIISIRRELHRFPEIGYDLPKTLALVKRELENMGLAYTDEYGEGSVVSYINPQKEGKAIALRADMDALPIEEKTGLPFKSEMKGQMHACGHDAHTACLLGVAKALCSMREKLDVKVKLIFQPDEEGVDSAAAKLIKNGILNDCDMILALHVDNSIESGKIGVCPGASMASCRNFTVEFFGKTAHAASAHTGADALAAAVKMYNMVHISLARKINPMENYVFSIGKLSGGTAQNVVADFASVMGTVRTYSLETDAFIFQQIKKAAQFAAEDSGCSFEISSSEVLPPVNNDMQLSAEILETAKRIAGKENAVLIPAKMSSEDFADYLLKVPGVLFRVGTQNPETTRTSAHNNDFVIDEKALKYGADTMIKFILEKNLAKN